MKTTETGRGFRVLEHTKYPPDVDEPQVCLIQESSVVGDYEDAMDKPGSSALWVGNDIHLNREEVDELVYYLQGW